MDDDLIKALEESRLKEKRQTLFYRALAAEAELAERPEDAERLNGLHADEQHHLSRLTARLLELGHEPENLRSIPRPEASLEGWDDVARERESSEIEWYERMLRTGVLDSSTRTVVEEILESERHHRDRLGGKWMSA